MKSFCFILIFGVLTATAFSQTTIQFPPDSAGHTTRVKVFPNPARGVVNVQLKDWDIKYRYTLNILNANGKRISTMILKGPVETVELKTSRKKATLFIEVWKEKELVGRETVIVIK
ncbi:MAG: hypothetical protein ACM3H8_13520 [Sphingobacteriales bacterium]